MTGSSRWCPRPGFSWSTSSDAPVDEEGSRPLFQIVINAYERQSVIFTPQASNSAAGTRVGNPNMAAALIDRTVHPGRMIGFEGEPYRRTHTPMG